MPVRNQVLQSGRIIPGDLAVWTTDGVISDGGMTLATVLTNNLFLTPQRFGAVGDGTADDTVAIQTAMNAAAAQKLPLLVVGGYVYAIDTVTIPSNLSVWGDNNTTFKLKNNAVGSLFAWALGATTTNVSFDSVLLDGNIAGQPGAPNNLIHGIFYSDATATVTMSRFTNLIASNIDGDLFGLGTIFVDCIFDTIRVNNHSQDAFALQPTRCHFSRIDIFNGSNTKIRGNCNGFIMNAALNCTFYAITVQLATLDAAGQKVGIALLGGSDNNLISGWLVDSGGANNNFAYSISQGTGNKLVNLVALNGAFNCDYELLSQNNLQGTNWTSLGVVDPGRGIVWNDCTNSTLSGYSLEGTLNASTNEDAIVFQNGCDGVIVSDYSINGLFSCFLITDGNNIQFRNGVAKALSGPGFHTTSSPAHTGLVVSGLILESVTVPWNIANLSNSQITDVVVVTATTSAAFVQATSCTDIQYNNLLGVTFSRQSGSGLNNLIGNRQAATYWSFGVHGGAIGTITLGVVLPAGAVVTRAFAQPTSRPTSATNVGTLSVGVAGDNVAFFNAINANASFVPGNIVAGNIDGTLPATYYPIGGTPLAVTVAIAGEALTAGVIQFYIDYDLGAA